MPDFAVQKLREPNQVGAQAAARSALQTVATVNTALRTPIQIFDSAPQEW